MRILLVDDDHRVRAAMADLLEVGGHEVEPAASGPDALGRFDAGRFDLVLTDLAMPGMSGWQVAAAIKARAPRCAVAVLTGWDDRNAFEEQRAGCVDRMLRKPCALEELLRAVRDLTAGEGAGLSAR